MTTAERTAAMTDEAWREELEKLAGDRAHNVPEWRSLDSNIAARRGPHALAALALYGQTFGFTSEDVTLLRDLARGVQATILLSAHPGAWPADYGEDARAKVDGLADRLDALLPPE